MKDRVPLDEIYGHPNFKCVGMISLGDRVRVQKSRKWSPRWHALLKTEARAMLMLYLLVEWPQNRRQWWHLWETTNVIIPWLSSHYPIIQLKVMNYYVSACVSFKIRVIIYACALPAQTGGQFTEKWTWLENEFPSSLIKNPYSVKMTEPKQTRRHKSK